MCYPWFLWGSWRCHRCYPWWCLSVNLFPTHACWRSATPPFSTSHRPLRTSALPTLVSRCSCFVSSFRICVHVIEC
ncbi:hypothetical protein EDB85DRAFT_1941720 [Lactarius pseudohatsudake]|nr:hypothetical protein EDB85DRAFT_1941720 [Lactarius pseudohatsudake]